MPISDQFSSTNLGLSYIAPAQAQKHVTVNESFRLLDAVVQLSVIDKDVTTPPTAPNEGDRYIVAATASGDWLDQDNNIAAFQDGAWAYFVPLAGWLTYVQDESVNYQYDGSVWVEVSSGGINEGDDVVLGLLGIGGATADTTNVMSFNGPAALFNNGGNGVQIKLNKNGVTDTASFLFQTGFSGRAEMGLTGDDHFHFKVSPDGSSWKEAFIINKTTGNISLSDNGATELTITGSGTGTHNGAIVYKATNGINRAIGAYMFNETSEIEWFAGNLYSDGDAFGVTRKITSSHTPSTANKANALFRIKGSGEVKIGSGNPTAKLDVDGAIRFKTYTVATLPSAVAIGAGAVIYVSDETGGAVMAFSDGTDWRRVTDRVIVS